MTKSGSCFGEWAREYEIYRPRYPSDLFAYLASVAPARRLAWDRGTGNGQAARALAEHFDRVFASDSSAEQLSRAIPHDRVEYGLSRAEDVLLRDGSVDLVTVATAVHWFDLDAFYAAVRRVAAPGGVVAVWTYHLPVGDPALDGVLSRLYWDVLAGCWPEGFRHVEAHYATLPFPFDDLRPPEFEMRATWDLEQLAGFLGTWSAAKRYAKDHGRDPVELIRPELVRAWGEPGRSREIRWPLYLKAGRAR